MPVTAVRTFFLSSQQLCAVGTLLTLILEVSKLSHRKVWEMAQG